MQEKPQTRMQWKLGQKSASVTPSGMKQGKSVAGIERGVLNERDASIERRQILMNTKFKLDP
jgi:hypothetical protein